MQVISPSGFTLTHVADIMDIPNTEDLHMIDLTNEVAEEAASTIAFRRHFHKHPELSFHEVKTSSYIERTLKSFGNDIEITKPTQTSVLATLTSKRPGPVLLVRADIDALPIQEENELPFRSEIPGVMHACGHDGHAAMLLSATKILHDHLDDLYGEVRMLFQHAEEVPPGGAIEIVRSGVVDDVDECFGLHLSSNYPTGKLGWCKGILTASTDKFSISIIGKGGHSAMPQQCIDPLPIAGQIIQALQTIPSRNIDPNDMLVLSICEIHGGNAYNIIPDTVTLSGSVRSFSPEARKTAEQRIKELSEGICAASKAQCQVTYELGYDSVINEEHLSDWTKDFIINQFGKAALLEIKPIMPGEDFCYLSEKCPSFFVELGARSVEKGIIFPHHNPKYLMDEDALSLGVEYLVSLLLSRSKFLAQHEG